MFEELTESTAQKDRFRFAANKLLTFQGENQVKQSFSVRIGKLFPRYGDDAEYDYFCRVNEAMEELCGAALVTAEYEKKGVLKKVILNLENLEACYAYLGRTPRRQEQEALMGIWEEIAERLSKERTGGSAGQGGNLGAEPLEPLRRYLATQYLRIEKNQNVEYFSQDLEEYRALLKAAAAVLLNREEVFIRNFSMQVFHEALRIVQDRLNSKNFYAFNPAFDNYEDCNDKPDCGCKN